MHHKYLWLVIFPELLESLLWTQGLFGASELTRTVLKERTWRGACSILGLACASDGRLWVVGTGGCEQSYDITAKTSTGIHLSAGFLSHTQHPPFPQADNLGLGALALVKCHIVLVQYM